MTIVLIPLVKLDRYSRHVEWSRKLGYNTVGPPCLLSEMVSLRLLYLSLKALLRNPAFDQSLNLFVSKDPQVDPK